MSWINCSERSPASDKDVLVYGDYSSRFSVAFISAIFGWCYSESHEPLDFEPTHWQPLPEPPKDD